MIYTFQKLLKLERVLDKALNKHWLCAYCMPCSKKSPRLEMWILISQALHPVSAAMSEMGEVLMQRGEQAAAGFLRAQSSLPGSQETRWATYPELLKPEWAWESYSVAAKKKKFCILSQTDQIRTSGGKTQEAVLYRNYSYMWWTEMCPPVSNSYVEALNPVWWCMCACMLSHFIRVQLFVTLWTVAHQASLSMGILQAKILDWVAVPSSRGSSWPRNQTRISYVFLHWQAGSLSLAPPGKPVMMHWGGLFEGNWV